MKIQIFVVALAGVALADSHQHQNHRRFHEKKRSVIHTDTKKVTMYSYNGQVMDKDSLCKKLDDGSIDWVGDNPPRPDCKKAPAPVAPNAAKSDGDVFEVPKPHFELPKPKIHSKPSDSKPSDSYPNAPVTVPSSHGSSNEDEGSSGGHNLDNPNTDKDFPDGKIDCSEFPSEYGAIPVPWIGLGKWSGIQHAQIAGKFVSHLATGTSGKDCAPGPNGAVAFCSYACPAGYQKTQWPQEQGGAGMAVSVGGLKCGSDNKLYLTNPGLSKKLCTRGTGTISVENKLGKGAAICRTDYPGTESETVPLYTTPGATFPLTCPESANYFQWQEKPTTAQYYVNDAGVSVEKACRWGEDKSGHGESFGNWAPINLGTGKDSNGLTWLSITSSCQNNPTKCNDLSYSIELEGDFGGNNGCYYTQSGGVGYWCSQGNLSDFKPDSPSCKSWSKGGAVPGCTVQLMSGKATYKFVPTKN